MARKKQEIILENVVIEAVAAEGKALARIDGTVLFVQFAVPGDIVDVKVTKKEEKLHGGLHPPHRKTVRASSRAVLQPFRRMWRLQMAATSIRNAASGKAAAGL